jgi:acetyl esterase/lipase
MTPLAEDLAGRGFAVWNIEYRRLGGGGGWPETFLDVAAAVDHLAEIRAQGVDLPLDRVVAAGHSAGGHLALWSAKRGGFPGIAGARVRVDAAVGMAPVADLVPAHSLAVGRNSVDEFLGGSPQSVRARFETASPRFLLPLGVRQLILHGTEDQALPVSLSQAYAQAAREAGDEVTFVELAGGGHMDFLDPGGRANASFRIVAYLTLPGVYPAAAEAVLSMMGKGVLADIDRRYQLTEAAHAHSDLESGATAGSLLLIP